MKKKFLFSALVTMCITMCTFCTSFAESISADTMKQRLSELQSMFPENSIWNDAYRVNGAEMSWQCMGWAETACDYLFKENPRAWIQQTNWNNLCVGDHVRINNNGHSILITNISADGNTITYADCNAGYDNRVHWNKTMSRSQLISKATWFKSQYDNWVRTLDNVSSNTSTGVAENTEKKANLGDSFYAVILNKVCWKPLEVCDDDYVRLGTENGTAKHYWKFDRNSDGSYTITSAQNGKVLDVEYSKDSDGMLIHTWEDVGGDNQRFFIHEQSGGYVIRPRHSNSRVLDMRSGNTADGTDLTLYSRNNTNAQIFSIYKENDVQMKAPTLTINTDGEEVIFDWNEVYGEKRYDLKIWKDKLYQGDAYKIEWNASKPYKIKLPAGHYEAYVDATNELQCLMSNTVSFDISEDAPNYAEISIDGDYFELGESVEFSFDYDTGESVSIGINKNGTRIATPEVTGKSKYVFTPTEAGEYSAYLSVWNKSGYVDSKYVYFTVEEMDTDDDYIYNEYDSSYDENDYNYDTEIILTIGTTRAYVDDEVVYNDVAPMIVNDRTMLPARFVAENLGADVIWTANEPNKVLIISDSTEIIIYIGSHVAYVNNKPVSLDSPAFIRNERTYTPVRFICEALGADVNWNQNTQTVTITK